MLELLTSKGLVRRWTLVQGEARCVEDAIAPFHADAAAAYGRSLFIKDLLERDAPGAEPDEALALLRDVRSGPQTPEGEAAAAALAALVNAAPPVAPPGAGRVRVRNLQLRMALTQAGLRDAVEAAVQSGPWQLKDLWDWSEFIHSDNEFIVAGCEGLGITAQQRMAIFAHAAQIEI